MLRKRGNINRGEVNAFLGRGTEFEGKLSFEGIVRLDGKFEGEIRADDTLIIGDTGEVNGEIYGNCVIVSGKVIGNINAKARIELKSPGKVYGNIKTPVLVLEEGVIFEGNCQMENRDEEGLVKLSSI
jgi:cytoskeletal protein CcmA (bactofilin family)